jgi:hypothetical protein
MAVAIVIRSRVWHDCWVSRYIGSFAAHKRVRERTIRGVLIVCCWRHSTAEVDRCHTDSNTILSVIDSTAVGKDVDVGAFRSELAVALQV